MQKPILFLLFFSSLALAFDRDKVADDYNQFLIHLGYEDYSNQMQNNLVAIREGKMQPFTVRTAENLKYNQERYMVFNYARDMAREMMVYMTEHKDDEQLLDRMVKFTGRMLSLEPLRPKVDPDEIKKLKTDKDWEAYLKNIEEKVVPDIMKKHSTLVASDAIYTLFGSEQTKAAIKKAKDENKWPTELKADLKLGTQVATWGALLTDFQYHDEGMGQTKYLGRALAACLRKFAEDNHREDPVQKLRGTLEKQGQHLENFVGDNLLIDTPNGPIQQHIKNFCFVDENSGTGESIQIAAAVIPNIKNMRLALKYHLLGNIFGLAFSKDDTPDPTTLYGRLEQQYQSNAKLNQGFSHTGVSYVAEDPRYPNIKMTWVVDSYPNSGQGGPRIIGPLEQFAKPGPFIRFGVSCYDPDKFLKYAKDYERHHPYNAVVWESDQEALDHNGESTPALSNGKPVKTGWPSLISPQEYKSVQNVPNNHAAAMNYFDQFGKKVTDTLIHKYLTEYGVGFAYGFSNYKGRTYCSQNPNMAALQATGIDLEPDQSTWRISMDLLKKLNIPGTDTLNLDTRIIPPMTYFVQKKVVHQPVTIVDYANMTPADRTRATTSAYYESLEPGLASYLGSQERFTKILARVTSGEAPDDDYMELLGNIFRAETAPDHKSRERDSH